MKRAKRHHEQTILEARFLYQVDHHDEGALAALLPDFSATGENFKLSDSAIFGTKEDGSVSSNTCRRRCDHKATSRRSKTTSPKPSGLAQTRRLFSLPHIERLRLDEAMQALKIDFSTRFTPLTPVVIR